MRMESYLSVSMKFLALMRKSRPSEFVLENLGKAKIRLFLELILN